MSVLYLWGVLQLLLSAAWLVHRSLDGLGLQHRHSRSLGRALIGGSVLLTAALWLLPEAAPFRPEPQAAITLSAEGDWVLHRMATGSVRTAASPLPLIGWQWLAGGLWLAAAAGLVHWAHQVRGLWSLRKQALRLKQIGRVEVLLSETLPGPAAAWLPGRLLVFVDPDTALSEDLGPALHHELQHHRSGDPMWAMGLGVLRAVCWVNPFVHAWAQRLAELDELACDEAIADRHRVDLHAYAHTLLRAAQRSAPLPQATLVALHPKRTLLVRRIHMLTQPRQTRPLATALAACIAVTALAATAVASDGLRVRHRAVSAASLTEVAHQASSERLEVPDHPLVEASVARLLQTDRSRAYYRASLDRKPEWDALIDDALDRYGLPEQLKAVPLIESGYRNYGESAEEALKPGVPGRGLWMFIAPTAREYGLRVDGEVDERLDPQAETDAAMRLLSDLHDQFGDWGLALAAYNQGPRKVQSAIDEVGSRDALVLCERGLLNDYVPMTYASMLLLSAPEWLD